LNELATERDPIDRGGRVRNMHTVSRAANDLCDGIRKCSDLGLKLCADRWLTYEDANENRQTGDVHDRIVLGVPVTRE
jgi:hypothetical protein